MNDFYMLMVATGGALIIIGLLVGFFVWWEEFTNGLWGDGEDSGEGPT